MNEMTIFSLPTPSLILDAEKVARNAAMMSRKIRALGCRLRPHFKTHKCVEIARVQTEGHFGGLTVSTLAEAQVLARHGFSDITYAVPIEPGKFEAVVDLSRRIRLNVVTDSLEIPPVLDDAARRAGLTVPVLIEIDCGDHRCGVAPSSPDLLEIARQIHDARHLEFSGILTHSGQSYQCRTLAERLEIARRERDVMNECAEALRTAGIPVETVSVGSTPAMTAADDLRGVTEARPGNYVLFDAFQSAHGSCGDEDCAVTVLASVIHLNRAERKIVIDAGAIALSKDTGARDVDPTCGFGRVLGLDGRDLGLTVSGVSQEHGKIIAPTDEHLAGLRIGSRLRVLANHSCLTTAQHSHFNVVEGETVVDRWKIHRGWGDS